MSWGAKIKILETENSLLKEKVEDLKEQRSQLQNQVIRLQECLIARESPIAYQTQKSAEYEANLSDEERDKIKKGHKIREIQSNFIGSLEEEDYFSEVKDPQDLEDLLKRAIGPPKIADTPLHEGNEES